MFLTQKKVNEQSIGHEDRLEWSERLARPISSKVFASRIRRKECRFNDRERQPRRFRHLLLLQVQRRKRARQDTILLQTKEARCLLACQWYK
nr:hypothetical protein [Candidatus Protochlamydia phocaeensis]